MKLTRRALCALASLPVWPTTPALAQAGFPSKPIRYVVPFAAGGLTDVMARLIGQSLAETLKQPVLVDNKPGAGANLGAEFVVKAPADGHTWLAVTLAHAVNQSLFPNIGYSMEKDLTPVAQLAGSPLVLVVPANHPAQNLKAFLDWAKGRPINGGSSGNGSPPHLGLELLAASAGLNVTHAPYRGGAPSLNDLMGGQIDFVVSNLPESSSFIKAGKLRALAITSEARHVLFPDIPTFSESGLPNVTLENWTGIMMPAGTSKAIVSRVAHDAVAAVKTPSIRERVTAMGFTVTGLLADEFAAVVKKDVARWRTIVQARGIKPE